MIPTRTTWGMNIRAAREARGLSQSALARELHISQGSVSMWERGDTAPRDLHRAALCSILGVDYLKLFPFEVPA